MTSYAVHEKLQNFMVPVPIQDIWHEEQIDELFASLLGKNFESAVGVYGGDAVDDDEREVEVEKRLEVELDGALKGVFRVFG
jgi:protein AATF/BFR2